VFRPIRHLGKSEIESGRCFRRPRPIKMATFSVHTASPPPSRTPAGSRASSRHSSIALRTRSVRGPLAGLHHQLVLVDQSHLRQRQRELHASHQQSLTRLSLEPLNGLLLDPLAPARPSNRPVQGARDHVLLAAAQEYRRSVKWHHQSGWEEFLRKPKDQWMSWEKPGNVRRVLM
jgi:hypothetical protein